MKSKKLISLLCAAALTASSFASLAVTASAADTVLYSNNFNGYPVDRALAVPYKNQTNWQAAADGGNELFRNLLAWNTPTSYKLIDNAGDLSDDELTAAAGVTIACGTGNDDDTSAVFVRAKADASDDLYMSIPRGRFGKQGNTLIEGFDTLTAATGEDKLISFKMMMTMNDTDRSDKTLQLQFGDLGTYDYTDAIEGTWQDVRAIVKADGTKEVYVGGEKKLTGTSTKTLDDLTIVMPSGGDKANNGKYPLINIDDMVVMSVAAGTGATATVPAAATVTDTATFGGEVIFATPVPDSTAPYFAAPADTTAGASVNFNGNANATWSIGASAQEITDISGIKINIGSRSDGDSSTYASVVNNVNDKILTLVGGQYSTAGRGPVVSLTDDLSIANDASKTAVMAFAVRLSTSSKNGAGRLYILADNVQIGEKSDGEYAHPMAILTTDGTGSSFHRSDESSTQIGVDVNADEWYTVTVMVSNNKYRVFLNDKQVVADEYVGAGDRAMTATALPLLAVTSMAAETSGVTNTSTYSVAKIDNILTYTGVLGEKAAALLPVTEAAPTPEPTPEPTLEPLPNVTLAVDESTAKATLTSDKASTVLVAQAEYTTGGALKQIKKFVNVDLTANTAKPVDLDTLVKGDKIMVWDNAKNMRPIASYTVQGGAAQATDAPKPTEAPTAAPTAAPTTAPGTTTAPTAVPTAAPTTAPGTTTAPTAVPTAAPTTAPGTTTAPTTAPGTTTAPTTAPGTTTAPTTAPGTTTAPTTAPGTTTAPTTAPGTTTAPTTAPGTTTAPTTAPGTTTAPTEAPTAAPTAAPTYTVSGTVDAGVDTVKLHPSNDDNVHTGDIKGEIKDAEAPATGKVVEFSNVPAGTYTIEVTAKTGYKDVVIKKGTEDVTSVTVTDANVTKAFAITTTKKIAVTGTVDAGVAEVKLVKKAEAATSSLLGEDDPSSTAAPTQVPVVETAAPTQVPVVETAAPTQVPVVETAAPTQVPVVETAAPTQVPVVETAAPTQVPVVETVAPTQVPVVETAAPTQVPVVETAAPTQEPVPAKTYTGTISNGKVTFDDVEAGTYTIAVTLKAGYKDAVIKIDDVVVTDVVVAAAGVTTLKITSKDAALYRENVTGLTTGNITYTLTADDVADKKDCKPTAEEIAIANVADFGTATAKTAAVAALDGWGYRHWGYPAGLKDSKGNIGRQTSARIDATANAVYVNGVGATGSNGAVSFIPANVTGLEVPSSGKIVYEFDAIAHVGTAIKNDRKMTFGLTSASDGTTVSNVANTTIKLEANSTEEIKQHMIMTYDYTTKVYTITADGVEIVNGKTETPVTGIYAMVDVDGSYQDAGIANLIVTTEESDPAITTGTVDPADGTLSIDRYSAVAGKTVTVTVTAAAGKKITSVKANDGAIELTPVAGETGKYTFTVPTPAAAINITATYARADVTSVTVDGPAQVQVGTSDKLTYTASAKAGETPVDATFTYSIAPADEEGATIKGTTAINSTTGELTLDATQTAGKIVVTATTKKDIANDGEAEVVIGTKEVEIATETLYTITKADTTNGSFKVNDSESTEVATAKENDVLTVVPDPVTGYEVDTVSYNDGTDHVITKDPAKGYQITVGKADITVTVTFKLINHTITNNNATPANGNSATITVGTNEASSDATINNVHYNDDITVNITKAAAYKVTKVAYNDGEEHVVTLKDNAYTFKMPNKDITVTVTFDAIQPVNYTNDFSSVAFEDKVSWITKAGQKPTGYSWVSTYRTGSVAVTDGAFVWTPDTYKKNTTLTNNYYGLFSSDIVDATSVYPYTVSFDYTPVVNQSNSANMNLELIDSNKNVILALPLTHNRVNSASASGVLYYYAGGKCAYKVADDEASANVQYDVDKNHGTKGLGANANKESNVIDTYKTTTFNTDKSNVYSVTLNVNPSTGNGTVTVKKGAATIIDAAAITVGANVGLSDIYLTSFNWHPNKTVGAEDVVGNPNPIILDNFSITAAPAE